MPRYTKDVSHLITQDEVRQLLGNSRDGRERVLTILLYLLGPRPIELVGLRAKDVEVKGSNITFTLPNSKIKNKSKFYFSHRTITYPLASTAFIEEVVSYWKGLNGPEAFFFPNYLNPSKHIGPIRVRQLYYRISNNTLFPYNNRHTRTVLWLRSGLDMASIMAFRGTLDIKALNNYVLGKQPKPPESVE